MDTLTAQIEDIRTFSLKEKAAAYFELTKPRIAFLLVLTSAAGFYIGTQGEFPIGLFIHSMIAITILASGVATLNQWFERSLDPKMERTAKRPLPSNRVTPNAALTFGVLNCAVAEAYLFFFVNGLTAFLGLLVIIGYVLLYTPLKTRTTACTAIGAFPGALPPLMGFTAATGEITMIAWALFAIQFFWQFPHFFAIAWMYRVQYRRAGIKMLPAVEPDGRITFRQIVMFTVLLVPVSLAPFFLGIDGIVYLVGAVILGGWFLWASIRSALSKSNQSAKALLLVSVIYLPLLFILMVADKR
ncbi:MAG TPA: heme o synthase [Pyrinomonadaceae bacterium]|nr:protoheme IX farnesyltransferase [Chloracidobacterium sp.]MBP9937029.1 heme o synthase [Pyrinomonadaceae bacterium]MBK7803794.1 protoheme IX farnesyltransferase [Chloracidobacterium sp.]MBK9439534.1 protoheme IX farnesyltransferase [Chloracidobacterium sp.]MBL0239178.1 protoheme IX farnesyltransferase [Chloracidobacterium sp.]